MWGISFAPWGVWTFPRLVALLLMLMLVREDAPRAPANNPQQVAAAESPATTAVTGRTMRTGGPLPASRMLDPKEAARFLAQATFGPTLDEIDRLRRQGYRKWIDEQASLPMSSQLRFMRALGEQAGRENRVDAWFNHALGAPDPFDPAVVHGDQLRQRVAFALSEIFVISDAASDSLSGHGMADYYDVLARNALGNYRTLLEQVTLHPTMGIFLSTMGNEKPDAARNVRPDENYAREVMQLFSVGLVRLNIDGTPMRDANGNTIATYNQDTIRGFAHVFTGWTFKGCREDDYFHCFAWESADPAWVAPMENWAEFHASAQSKQLLSYPGVSLPGGVLAGGGSAQSDLKLAIDNIFRHPNVGPFIGRQLIQRLVTSNPSPAYVARVAAQFNNNGRGVRGDMKAVVQAILLDPEARDPASQPANFGKVREPLLRLTHLWRAMNARSQNGMMDEYWSLTMWGIGQSPMYAPSVFNFFSPTYAPVGELSQLGLAAPELQLATDYMVPTTFGYLEWKIFDQWQGTPDPGPSDMLMDYARDLPLTTNPAALIDRYNLLFLSGQMSAGMRQVLLNRLAQMPASTVEQRRERLQEMLYLIVNSPEYLVQK